MQIACFFHIRKMVFFLSLCSISLLTGMLSACSSAAPKTPVQIPSFSPSCQVLFVQLSGKNNAQAKCQAQTSAVTSASPEKLCATDKTAVLEIATADGDAVCFSGHGYLGFRLGHISYIDAALNGGDSGWVRYYPEGSTSGNFFYLNSDSKCYRGYNAYCAKYFVSLIPTVGITQVSLD